MNDPRTLIRLINSIATNPKNFSVLVGAGVSVSAGIPLAETDLPGLPSIVTRVKELTYQRMNPAKPPIPEEIEAWLASQALLQNATTRHSDAFDLVGSTSTEHRNFLKPFFEGKRPTPGHRHLAALMAEGYFACTFTTNFDDLMEEAIRSLRPQENRLIPQVVAHDQSARDLDPLDSNLKIVKLHGDFLFSDINNTDQQTKDLRKYMREGLELFLRVGGLIIVGYSGCDESIMAPLENSMDDPNAFRYPLYWIIREDSEPPERVSRLLARAGNRAALIQAPNSDQFFWQLRRHLCGEEAAGPQPGSHEPFPAASPEVRAALVQAAVDEHLNALITQIESESWYHRYQPLAVRQLVLREKDGQPSSRLSDIFGAADQNSCLLILGAPGAGKTTSVRRFALDKARGGEWVPISVELGGYRGDLLALIQAYFHGSSSPQMVQSLLDSKRCYVILDGLNETGEHYHALVDEIFALLRQYGSTRHRWIVTCRSYNYGGELDSAFCPMEVQPLVTFEVFQSLQKVIGRDPAKGWWETMNDSIRLLCTNPLMLRMLLDVAMMLKDPPRTRRELIGGFLDELLLKWERRLREVRLGSVIQKQLLGAVAFDMGASVTTIAKTRTLELIGGRLADLIEQTLAPENAEPGRALDELLTNGLLRKTGEQIAFMHQAIQEYFLALELLRRKSDVSGYVQNEQWRETLMYMCEMASNPRPIVELILQHDAKLAADCLEFVKTEDQALVDPAIRGLIVLWSKAEGIFVGSEKDIAERILSLAERTQTTLLTLLAQSHPEASNEGNPGNLYIRLLQEAGEWEKALRASEALALEGQEARFQYHARRGISLDSMGQPQTAKTEYENALAINPDSDWVRGNLANTLVSLRDYEGAEKEYKRTLAVGGTLNLSNYGSLLRLRGRLPEARVYLRKSIERDPSYHGAYYQLGLIEESERNFPLAAVLLQKAAELADDDENCFKAAGDAWEKSSRMDMAIVAWREFLDLAPTHKEAQAVYGKILHYEGRDHLFTSRRVGAVKWFDDARGYGFIAQEDGSEIFVHYSGIESTGWRTLSEGTRVEFEVQETPKGFKAVNVRPRSLW